jgi:hypothetical protein
MGKDLQLSSSSASTESGSAMSTSGTMSMLADRSYSSKGTKPNTNKNQNKTTYTGITKTTTQFKGETIEMNENVFQVHTEQKNEDSFKLQWMHYKFLHRQNIKRKYNI